MNTPPGFKYVSSTDRIVGSNSEDAILLPASDTGFTKNVPFAVLTKRRRLAPQAAARAEPRNAGRIRKNTGCAIPNMLSTGPKQVYGFGLGYYRLTRNHFLQLPLIELHASPGRSASAPGASRLR